MLTRNHTKTDSEQSISSDEFVWDMDGVTEAMMYVAPMVCRSLGMAGARRVLDLGCGNGAFAGRLAAAGYEAWGIDASRSGIEHARNSQPSLRFAHGELTEKLPADWRAQFDGVVSTEVIEHLLLPRCLFARAREALRPGGILIVSTPYHGYLKNLALAVAGKFDRHWHPLRDHGHVKFFSRDTLSRLFVEQGFEVIGFARVGRIPILARSMIMMGRWKG